MAKEHIRRHGNTSYGTTRPSTNECDSHRRYRGLGIADREPPISKARIVDPKGVSGTLLHIAVDWPGHFPKVSQTMGLLIERGADPDGPIVGGNAPERPLHWAAGSDDVDALDALLNGGPTSKAQELFSRTAPPCPTPSSSAVERRTPVA